MIQPVIAFGQPNPQRIEDEGGGQVLSDHHRILDQLHLIPSLRQFLPCRIRHCLIGHKLLDPAQDRCIMCRPASALRSVRYAFDIFGTEAAPLSDFDMLSPFVWCAGKPGNPKNRQFAFTRRDAPLEKHCPHFHLAAEDFAMLHHQAQKFRHLCGAPGTCLFPQRVDQFPSRGADVLICNCLDARPVAEYLSMTFGNMSICPVLLDDCPLIRCR